jgi:hypothetical protein
MKGSGRVSPASPTFILSSSLITVVMSIFFAHPVVDLNPSTSKIFSSYSTEEFRTIGVNGLLGGCLGYAYQWVRSNSEKGESVYCVPVVFPRISVQDR